MGTGSISQGITSFFNNAASLKSLYAFMVDNPQLSLAQGIRIKLINPEATICYSFDEWNKTHKRKIHQGSRSLQIEDDNGRKMYLFDIKQTYGENYKSSQNHSERHVFEAVQSLNVFKVSANGTTAEKIHLAVQDYCKNNTFYNSEPNADYEQAVAIGVSSCVFYKNKIQNSLSFEPLAFDEDTSIKIALDVISISKTILLYIDNYKRSEDFYGTEQQYRNNEAARKNADNRAVAREPHRTAQRERSEQMGFLDSEVFTSTVPGTIFEITSGRQDNRVNISAATTGDRVDGNAGGANAATEQAPGQLGLLDNSQATKLDSPESGRASVGSDSLLNSALENYRLTEENFNYSTGAKTRYKNNVVAIELIYKLEKEKRSATPEEQKKLAAYVGWGALSQAFDEKNNNWQDEYKELKNLLSLEDYELAKGSMLNAHYTSNIVINGIYEGLDRLGYKNGSILEPATGIGNFIGLMPEHFNSKFYGVELDSITGRIAKQLYPNAEILVTGFEKTSFPNNYFDCVLTNVPFGSYKVNDKDYNNLDFYIHDYFIAKAIDKLRPGGVMAVITSKGTMDKANYSVRNYIAERAELLGAIRLPNTAFKASAGTEVTSDILFFKKREQRVDASNEDWVYTGYDSKGIPLNSYYLHNPQMLLGEMAQGKTLYGGETETTLNPDERELGAALSEAVKNLPENIYSERAIKHENATEGASDMPADLSVRNFCYEIINEKLYMRIDDKMQPVDVSKNNFERMRHLIAIRKQVRQLLDIQFAGEPDSVLTSEQSKLNSLYDTFVERYGTLNSKFNKNLFRDDADYPLLITLEKLDEKGENVTKSDIFTKRTIKPRVKVTSAQNCVEALHISKNEYGRADISYIEKLTGKNYNQVIQELSGFLYKNPLADTLEEDKYAGWETADEYLSGNVKEKLNIAQRAATANPIYQKNVDALIKAQPERLTAAEISVKMGVTWVDKKIYEQFLIETFKLSRYQRPYLHIDYNTFTGVWDVAIRSNFVDTVEANKIYGTSRMNAYEIAEKTLNLVTPSIYDTVYENGKEKRVLNRNETIAVREKQNKLKEEFKRWIFEDADRRNKLVDIYNEKFNNVKLPKYDGSYLTFEGINPLIELRPHQKDAVERIIVSGNTLLHHVVGAGKTFTIAAAIMKMKQYGIVNKPIIAVPNHLVEQWAREFKTLYPNANLLLATKKDFQKENRLKFVSRIATGEWDAIIIAHTSFEMIPLTLERQAKKIRTEISNIETAISELRNDTDSNITRKTLERTLKNKKVTLEKLLEGRKDNLINFESLGIDCLSVDEAHKFKNKFIFTKMNNVAGLSRAMSKRASDMDMKCEYINEKNGGSKGVIFATGTPISNSMVEMYTMQSYLQRDVLVKAGMEYFDAWAANFGETVTALELAPSGQGYRTKTRFAKFTNLPELLKMYRSFADVKTADMLNLPTPKPNWHLIKTQPSDDVLKGNDDITKRAEKMSNGRVDPTIDNMLKVTGDGKKLALDPRLYLDDAEDNSINKVNICVGKIKEIWDKTHSIKGTQVVFCDLSTPKSMFQNYDPDKGFDVYNDIKYKLVKSGIPEKDIAFIHDANTDIRKQALFDDVKRGNIRILLGSTEKCGAGTNIQDYLVALHHLDTPYRPSDLEQREGRIIRQGNRNKEVDIFTYVTERTFDSYSYQILENKMRFISQINRGDLTVREAADIDETTLTYAEIKAITAANPKIKRKMELEAEQGRLRILEGQYKQSKYVMEDKIQIELPNEINRLTNRVANYESDVTQRNASKVKEFLIQFGNKQFTERKDAGELLLNVVAAPNYIGKCVGQYNGFDIYPNPINLLTERTITLKGKNNYEIKISESAVGSIQRIENYINGLDNELEKNKQDLENTKRNLTVLKQEVEKPFEYAEQLKQNLSELFAINAELDLGKDVEVVIDDEKFKNEKFESDEDIDNEAPDEDDIDIKPARKEIKNETPNARSEAPQKQPIEKLLVYSERENMVVIKLPIERSTEKKIIYLNISDIIIDKDGFVTHATENCIKNFGLPRPGVGKINQKK